MLGHSGEQDSPFRLDSLGGVVQLCLVPSSEPGPWARMGAPTRPGVAGFQHLLWRSGGSRWAVSLLRCWPGFWASVTRLVLRGAVGRGQEEVEQRPGQ